MRIDNHLLADPSVTQVNTPNCGGNIVPRFLVFHYTAGSDAQSSVTTLCTQKPSGNASAHIVIARDGMIFQLMPFNVEAWHAGLSAWRGTTGFNRCSIGIELDNAGRLQKVGVRYVAWFGRDYPEEAVLKARHKNESAESYWHVYTEAQIQRALEVAELLVAQYRLEDIVGHDDIAPGRKSDPGPAFPLENIHARVFGRQTMSPPRCKVMTDLLNIRAGPGASHSTVASPLPFGTELAVLETREQWLRVQVIGASGVEGWVSARFVENV